MPKIPRSRDYYERYTPSAPPMVPMGLADYSAWSDALEKGAAFAAKKYHQKNNEEAKLAINAYANFATELGAEFERRPYEPSALESGGKPAPLAERSEKRNSDHDVALKARLPDSDDWSSANRIALEAVTQNALSMNRSKTKLLESKTLVSAHQANYSKWEENMLKRIRSINPGDNLDKIKREMTGSWDLRLEDASAGGLMENPKQVQTSKLAFEARVVTALFERYESVWFNRMDESSITTKGDLESTITDSMSDQERKAAGVYGSYMEFYRDVKENGLIAGYDINALSPDKSNLEFAKESHDRIFGRLTKNRVARKTAATANFNAAFNEYMTLASREQRGFNDVEMNHIKALANVAGVRLSSHFFNFQKKAESEPTLLQKSNNSLIEYEFEMIKTNALNRDVEPDFTVFTNRVMKAYNEDLLHVSDMKSIFKELGTARTAKGKRINEDVKEVMDLFSKEYLVKTQFKNGRKRLSTGPDDQIGFYEGLNAEIAGDITPFIRDAVRRAHASNKTVDPQKIYNEAVSHIQKVKRNQDPLKINIMQEELEPILKKRQEGGVLDDKEQLTYDLSLAKMGRNARFRRAAKKYSAAERSLKGVSPADIKKFKLQYKEELSFLMPGGYDIEDLHNKYRRRVDSAKPKEGAGTTAQPKEATGDQVDDTKLPVPEDTGEKSYEEMDIAELMSAFKENPAKVWKDLPDEFKDKMKPHLGLLGLKEDEQGSVVADVEKVELKKQPPRPSPHDETKVRTLSKSGKFETKQERGESMKEAKINKSVIASVISNVKDAFAGGDKGGKAIADYKANLEKEWGSPIPKVLSGWIGQLYDAGETVLAEELYGVLALLSGDVEVAPPEVPVAEYKDFKEEHGYTPDELFSVEGLKDYDFPFEYLADKLREYEDAPNKDANDKKMIRILRRKIKAETGE